MREGGFVPSVSTLIVIAFTTILVALFATGLVIRYEADRVHRQTYQIMENGTPSLIAATRLKDLLGAFPLDPPEPGSREQRRFEKAAAKFQEVLDAQNQASSFFTGEQLELANLQNRFARLQAMVRAGHEDFQTPGGTFEAQVDELRAACERFEQINRDGMRAAQASLFDVAYKEDIALLVGFSAAGLIALAWGVVLSDAIAKPLVALRQEVGALAERPAMPGASPRWHVPHEIRGLEQELFQSAARIRDVSHEREQVLQQLEASLEREHALNAGLASANASLDQQVALKTAELAEANHQLAAMIAELQEQARSKSSFLAAVSHELRTPLAVIKGGALTLSGLGARLDAGATAQLLGNIVTDADHLAKLVDDLLDAAQMDAGAFRIAVEPVVEPAALIGAVVTGLASLFDEQGVHLVLEVAASLPAIEADPERLRQVLRNVLENAAKFSPPHGTVRLEVEVEDAASDPSGRLVFRVADEGPGIAPELAARLFTPFVRGEGHVGGTGLGLSIARELLLAHGGDIRLDPNAAGGSTFTFWLPLTASYNFTS